MPGVIKTFLTEHATALSVAAGLSVMVFVVGLVAVPIVLVRMDRDYFLIEQRSSALRRRFPLAMPVVLVLRNLMGALLLIAGVVMLLTPGQGLLTILAGLMTMDFPGKYRLERKFIGWKPVYRSVTWLRKRFGREPFRLHHAPPDPQS